jgi:hypothetical protein
MDIGHRHCKKRLANLKENLETRATEEAEWEKHERSALQHYSRAEAGGCLTLVNDHSIIAAHDHGMNIPIDNEEVSKIHVVKKPNRKVPMTDAYNPHFPWCGGAKAP